MIKRMDMLRYGLGLLVIILAISSLSIGCLARQTYKNPSLGFTIQLPADWIIYESSNSKQVTLGTQVDIHIDTYDALLSPDLLGHLETVAQTNLESGTFVEAEKPESIRIHNYEAAQIRTIATLHPALISVPSRPDNVPEWEFTDVPTNIIVITNGIQLATIIIVQPDATTEQIVHSFAFCCD